MVIFIIALLASIPFWIVYTLCGIGEKFFYFLPVVYQSPGYWNIVGLFIIVLILKRILFVRVIGWAEFAHDIKEIIKKKK